MSNWTHAICDPCWTIRQPGRTPHRIVDEYVELETCCFCGWPTESGIYVREHPEKTTKCRGHDDD